MNPGPLRYTRYAARISPAKSLRNGTYANASQTPKREVRNEAKQRTQALSHTCACRSIARGMADRPAPPVRARTGLRARESDERTIFSEFRVSNPASKSSYRVAIRAWDPAVISDHALILRRASSAPASTSRSRLRGWRRSVAPKPPLRAATCQLFPSCISATTAGAASIFRAGKDCPPALRVAAAAFDVGHDGMLPDDRYNELESFMALASKSGEHRPPRADRDSAPRWPRPGRDHP